MFLAEQPPALPAVDAAVHRTEAPAADGLRADVVAPRPLPVFSCYQLVGVDNRLWLLRRPWCRRRGQGLCFVRLEDLEATELLVDHRERLKPFRLENLLVEPGLDVVLFYFGKFFVRIFNMPVFRQY